MLASIMTTLKGYHGSCSGIKGSLVRDQFLRETLVLYVILCNEVPTPSFPYLLFQINFQLVFAVDARLNLWLFTEIWRRKSPPP